MCVCVCVCGGSEESCEQNPLVQLKCSHHKKIYLKHDSATIWALQHSYRYGLFSANSFEMWMEVLEVALTKIVLFLLAE